MRELHNQQQPTKAERDSDKNEKQRSREAITYLIGGRGHAARVEVNIESGAELPRTGSDMDAIGVAVVAFGEDHSVERPVEFDVDAHVGLFALDLQVLDLRLVGCCANWPLIFRSRADRCPLGWIAGQAGWWWQQSRTTGAVIRWR